MRRRHCFSEADHVQITGKVKIACGHSNAPIECMQGALYFVNELAKRSTVEKGATASMNGRKGRLSGDSQERDAKDIIRSASFKLGQLCETTRDKHECFDVIGPAMAKAEIRIARVMKKL